MTWYRAHNTNPAHSTKVYYLELEDTDDILNDPYWIIVPATPEEVIIQCDLLGVAVRGQKRW